MKNSSLSIACIRSMIIDITNKAKSGHPGMAIGSAPILYTLYTKHLKADPNNPNWINRDRFVLSAGHASSLLYTILHLCKYDIKIDDLMKFRQLKSITPGHPENHLTPGVDATSGPLGQGIAQAVGLAVAELALKNNLENGRSIIDHYTYCLVGDGCLQEGVSQEAISFAGNQKLNKLIVFYDSNKITLDGDLSLTSNENTKMRFESCGWNVLQVSDGNSIDQIDKAIIKAKTSDKPTLIIVNTIIGQGSKFEGTSKVHGSPIGEEDGIRAKKSYNYEYPPFFVPQEVYDDFETSFVKRGAKEYAAWEKKLSAYKRAHPRCATQLESTEKNDISTYVFDNIPHFEEGLKEATRTTSGNILNLLHSSIPNLIGGSADVASSVKTAIKEGKDFNINNRDGKNINFGIREFAMASIQNGILLHGGLRTYAGCFLVFSDYLKPAIRIASLSKLPAVYLFSHDTIALGEDGSTHQPIEQLAMLRSIPGVEVFRPCDAREVAASYMHAFKQYDHPVCIILSRQNLPLITGSASEDITKGGYIISKEAGNNPVLTLIATGSEVELAIEAQKELRVNGVDIRVVSMPSIELFLKQDPAYIQTVLGNPYEKRFVVEMLSTFGWHKLAPHVMGLDTFGLSAPASDIVKYYGFTKEELIRRIREVI